MSKQREEPHVTAETDRLAVERNERLGMALRANLQRRKAQRRERDAGGEDPDKDGALP